MGAQLCGKGEGRVASHDPVDRPQTFRGHITWAPQPPQKVWRDLRLDVYTFPGQSGMLNHTAVRLYKMAYSESSPLLQKTML